MIEVKLTFATFGEAAEAMARMGGAGGWPTLAEQVRAEPPKEVRVDYQVEIGEPKAEAAEPEAPARKRGRPPKVADPATQTVAVDESDVKATSLADVAPIAEPAKPQPEPKRELTPEEKAAFDKAKRDAISEVMAVIGQEGARKHMERFREGIRKMSHIEFEEAEAFYAWCKNADEIQKSKGAV